MQNLQTPLRRFLRTETGGAAVLLAATLAALAWANVDPAGYAATWHAVLVIRSGRWELADSWQGWVNSGLMSFFFLVAGLEARREFDMGELRERRRLALPVVVALGGMVVPVAIYLAVNAGRPSASGWGAAMATDTAFAVADDVAGIVVIAVVYSDRIDLTALGAGLAFLGLVVAAPAGCPAWPRLPVAGRGGVDRVLRVGRRSGGGRPGDGPARPRLPGHAP